MNPQPTITLQLMADAPDSNGEPRAGLLVPSPPASTNRRPVLLLFATVAAALAEKRAMEGREPRFSPDLPAKTGGDSVSIG